mgnify:CR=1 FL=1
MTNKSRIKIVIVTFFIAAVLFSLFFRWNKYSPGWGKGDISVSEASYYVGRMDSILKNWIQIRDNANFNDDGYYADSYQSYLIFDFAKQAMWIEDSGWILQDNYVEFPAGMKWTFYHITPNGMTELTGRIILKYRGFDTNRQTQEAFYLIGSGGGKGYVNCQIYGQNSSAGYSKNEISMPQLNPRISKRKD